MSYGDLIKISEDLTTALEESGYSFDDTKIEKRN